MEITAFDIFLTIFTSIVKIGCPICLGLAIYYDAKSQKNQHSLIWALLSAFFGIIVALIYFIVRSKEKNRLVHCNSCNQLTSKKSGFCTYCNKPLFDQNEIEEYRKKVKLFGILAAVFFLVSAIIGAITSYSTILHALS